MNIKLKKTLLFHLVIVLGLVLHLEKSFVASGVLPAGSGYSFLQKPINDVSAVLLHSQRLTRLSPAYRRKVIASLALRPSLINYIACRIIRVNTRCNFSVLYNNILYFDIPPPSRI